MKNIIDDAGDICKRRFRFDVLSLDTVALHRPRRDVAEISGSNKGCVASKLHYLLGAKRIDPNSRISNFWPARNGIVVSTSKKAISDRSSAGARPFIVNWLDLI
ncbi:unnamed protein product [Microthlaspi erraticum]|uniref:Uncharacterized protein n=1 Tax=Microthlaspi erraticum TaxID=1685480 RepID=A0A6D2K700_9BRAS|nr:unnamed protein product [Microthlaspi erraticum]